ncbi:MAG: phosphatidylinositol kinase [Bacteroidetes bacterium]|nr:phosphatidylinositol kinase [Bacteroidota bacterium]
MRKAKIFYKDLFAGVLIEDEDGYSFEYNKDYLLRNNPQPISLTIPISNKIYKSNILFPFFDGLIPEGWLLDIAQKNWKITNNDRMSLLLACCKDCIGAISVIPFNNDQL